MFPQVAARVAAEMFPQAAAEMALGKGHNAKTLFDLD
jgi:hypothetical protein